MSSLRYAFGAMASVIAMTLANASPGPLRAIPDPLPPLQLAPAGQVIAGSITGVPAPLAQLRPIEFERGVRISVPRNWSIVDTRDGTVTYAPEGAYYQTRGREPTITHGVQVGTTPGWTGNLQQDTERLLAGLTRANPEMRRQEGFTRERLGGRAALFTKLTNVSQATGDREAVLLSTTHLPDNRLLFLAGVAPYSEAKLYETTFRRIRDSVEIDAR